MLFLYYVPRFYRQGSNKLERQIYENFETEDSIESLLSEYKQYIPMLTSLNVANSNWKQCLSNERVFNYTYGFGRYKESINPTYVLEASGVDYIGARPHGFFFSANKPHCTALMSSSGFRVPREKILVRSITHEDALSLCNYFIDAQFLVCKPAYEESSIGLEIIYNDPDIVFSSCNSLYESVKDTIIVQEYIHGIDLTVPIIGRSRYRVMPALQLLRKNNRAEPFVFDAVSKAKKQDLEYKVISDWNVTLRSKIYHMAIMASILTQQRDYARMDCRVTQDGKIIFLEINANPQLDLDKGSFSIAARSVGIKVGELFRLIVDDQEPPFGENPLSIGL